MFYFDQVFAQSSTDDEVYASLHEDVISALRGHLVCIFAYGATGGGKTHTIEELSRRSIATIEKEARPVKGERLKIKAQIVEVYNETFRDLLSPETPSTSLKVVSDPCDSTSVVLANSVMHPINPEKVGSELLGVFRMAKHNRSTESTIHNERSSRSHLIITISFSRHAKDGVVLSAGKLSLVDLAGSERLKNVDANDPRMKEGQYINKSLAALGNVLWAHERKVKYIPFRNSKLTHLLQDSLGGRMSRTVMIIALSPISETMPETIQSIYFGSRLNNLAFSSGGTERLANNAEHSRLRSIVEQRSIDVERLEDENLQLKEEICSLRENYYHKAENLEIMSKKLQSQEDELRKERLRIEALDKEVAQLRAQKGSTVTSPSSQLRVVDIEDHNSRTSPTQTSGLRSEESESPASVALTSVISPADSKDHSNMKRILEIQKVRPPMIETNFFVWSDMQQPTPRTSIATSIANSTSPIRPAHAKTTSVAPVSAVPKSLNIGLPKRLVSPNRNSIQLPCSNEREKDNCSTTSSSGPKDKPKRRNSFSVNPIAPQAARLLGYNCKPSDHSDGDADLSKSPLLFITRDLADPEDTLSQISQSSNGSEIRQRLERSLLAEKQIQLSAPQIAIPPLRLRQ